MSVIENIDVVMGAQTTELDAAVAKEIKNLRDLGKVAKGFDLSSIAPIDIAQIKNYAAGLVGAAAAWKGIHSVVTNIRDEMEKIDQLSDSAAKLGTSVADLRAIQFSIGETSGMDPDSINQAIQKMQISMVDALKNSEGEMAKTFSSIGLNAKELLSKGPVDAIGDIADAIAKLETPAQQLEFATSVFGKSAGGIVQSLREGRGPMSEWVAYAKQYGLLISDADAEIIGMTNDSMARLGVATEGWYTQLSLLISPTLKLISDDLAKMVPKAKETEDHIWSWSAYLANAYGAAKELFNLVGDLSRKDFASLMFRQSDSKKALEQFDKMHEDAQKAADQKKIDREQKSIQDSIDAAVKKKQDEETKRVEDLAKKKQDFIGNLKEELELIKAQNEARAAGKDFDPTIFKMRREFEKLGEAGIGLQFNRLEGKLKSERDTARDLDAFKSLEAEAKRIKEETKALVSGVDFNKELFDRRNRFEQAGGDVAEFDKQSAELLRQQNIQDEINKIKQEKEKKPENKFGAVSAQEGSVEAYKLLLQKDNEQKGIREEARRQTELQQRMTDLLQKANDRPVVQLVRAR